MEYYFKFPISGYPTVIESPQPLLLTKLQEEIGGFIEYCKIKTLPLNAVLILNKDRRLYNLPPNPFWSQHQGVVLVYFSNTYKVGETDGLSKL